MQFVTTTFSVGYDSPRPSQRQRPLLSTMASSAVAMRQSEMRTLREPSTSTPSELAARSRSDSMVTPRSTTPSQPHSRTFHSVELTRVTSSTRTSRHRLKTKVIAWSPRRSQRRVSTPARAARRSSSRISVSCSSGGPHS